MKNKHFSPVKIIYHTLYWLGIIGILTLLFGQESNDFKQAFFFATLMLPVAMGTSYFFIYFLIPRYLLAKRFALFALYFVYTVIIALYLEMLAAIGAFVLYANFQYAEMNPISTDVVTMGIVILFVVFATAFGHLLIAYFQKEKQLELFSERNERDQKVILQIKSDRKNIPIELSKVTYIESLSDYVKIHTSGSSYVTKEKISQLEQALPSHFIRIHRSFIVNSRLIDSFTRENLTIQKVQLPISRTYKAQVLSLLMDD